MRQDLLKRYLTIIFFAILTMMLAFSASAQKKKKKGEGGVIRLEETIIEGRVAKPNAFFINTRQALVYETMEIKESFIDEIEKAVSNGPF